MIHRVISLIFLTALVQTAAIPPSVWAGAVTEQMRDTVEQVVAIVQDSRLKGAGRQEERRERLRQVIGARFDFNEMAKRSLGQNWQRRSPEEQREFASLFTALLEKAYADQIEAFHGEKIVFGRERQDENVAEVESKIVTGKRDELAVNYKLLTAGGEWKVYE